MVKITSANFSFTEILLSGPSPLCALPHLLLIIIPVLQIISLSLNFHNFLAGCQKVYYLETNQNSNTRLSDYRLGVLNHDTLFPSLLGNKATLHQSQGFQ